MKMPPPIATKFTKLVLTILAITILGIILSFVSQDHTLLKVEPVGPSVDDAALAMIALRFLEGFLQKRCGVEISGSICSDLLGQKQR